MKILFFLVLIFAGSLTDLQGQAPFYEGKSLTFIVGSTWAPGDHGHAGIGRAWPAGRDIAGNTAGADKVVARCVHEEHERSGASRRGEAEEDRHHCRERRGTDEDRPRRYRSAPRCHRADPKNFGVLTRPTSRGSHSQSPFISRGAEYLML